MANELINEFLRKEIKTKYVWLRFNPFFTIPVLIYGRITGLTVYKMKNGVRIGHHNFSKSKIIKNTYPILLFIDMLLAKLIKINIPHIFGYCIICDRYVLDSIVDMIIDLKLNKEEVTWVCNLFSKLLPKNNKILLVEADLEIMYSRRVSLKFDDTLESRRELYNFVCKDFNVCTVSNNKSIDHSLMAIFDCIGVNK